MPRPWTEDEIATVISLLSEGKSMREAGEAIGKSKSAVAGFINRGDYGDFKPGRIELQDEEKQVIRDLWYTKLSVLEIAQKIGRSSSAVSKYAHRVGLGRKDVSGFKRHVSLESLNKTLPYGEREYEFTETPLPENAPLIPFLDLKPGQCKWVCNEFYDEYSVEETKCCGLPVLNYKGTAMQRNYCQAHYNASIKKD